MIEKAIEGRRHENGWKIEAVKKEENRLVHKSKG
jgi:hypothetical protein